MKPCLFVTFFAVLFFSSTFLYAQQGHVYEDSSVLYPQDETMQDEEIVEAPVAENNSDQTTTAIEVDTQLISNRHFLSTDSIRALQNDQQFLYAKKLDSLLHELQKEKQPKERGSTRETSGGISSSAPTMIESFFNAGATQYILWGLAGLFVLFILFKLLVSGGTFRKSSAKNLVSMIAEEEALPVLGSDFEGPVAKAVREKNYRLAVRYLYLQLLQRLSAAGAIEFAVDKTNTEYLREITGKPFKDDVAVLTRYYEYAWYGEFAIDEMAYRQVAEKFKRVII